MGSEDAGGAPRSKGHKGEGVEGMHPMTLSHTCIFSTLFLQTFNEVSALDEVHEGSLARGNGPRSRENGRGRVCNTNKL